MQLLRASGRARSRQECHRAAHGVTDQLIFAQDLHLQLHWHALTCARRVQGEVVSNHDELMCNFFAQAGALATGKSAIELRTESLLSL